MTGRPERAMRPGGVRRLGSAVLALVLAATVAGCGDSDGGAPPTSSSPPAVSGEVAVCADLRERENELIRVANEALSALARAEGDEARAAALTTGYDRLIATLEDQEPLAVPDLPDLPDLAAKLVAGQQAAVQALSAARDRFVAEVPAVAQADEHGRAGELQADLEKVFSELEPARSVYVDAGLEEAIDADPACEHVTQRGDPAR